MARATVADSELMTAHGLFALPDDSWQYELDEGALIQMPLAGGIHGATEMRLAAALFRFVEGDDLGKLYPDTGFVLSQDPDTVRAPDVAFVRKDRVPLPTHDEKGEGYLIGAPDLAIEIQSAHQSPADLGRKVEQYLAAGTPCVWVVRRRRRVADLYEGSQLTTIDENGFLEASVLQGFRIRLGDILPRRA